MSEMKLKSCPFCGGKVNILVCDDEGNIHDAEYEKAPWSGLGYRLSHEVTDVPEGQRCPIAGFEDEGELGTYIYDTREDAAEAWNERTLIHGKWLLEREPDGTPYCFHCSVCDADFHHVGVKSATDYCPNCGAKMDGRSDT